MRFIRISLLAAILAGFYSCDKNDGYSKYETTCMIADFDDAGEVVTTQEDSEQYSYLRFVVRGKHSGNTPEGKWLFEVHMYTYIDVYKNTDLEGKLKGYYSGEIYFPEFEINVSKLKVDPQNPRRSDTFLYVSDATDLPYYYTNPGRFYIEYIKESWKIYAIEGMQPVISCLPEDIRIGFTDFTYDYRLTPSLSFTVVNRENVVISKINCRGYLFEFYKTEDSEQWENLNPMDDYLDNPEDIPYI